MQKIILATKSPYRKKAFEFLGLDFVCEASEVDEYSEGRPSDPEKLVEYLAKLKAEAVAENHKKGIVIGFDSVGFFQEKILEKPKSMKEEFERLKALSGSKFLFYTGVYAKNVENCKRVLRVVETEALMRDLSDYEINKYLNQDKNFNTYALGFDPLGHLSSSFILKINGSYNNLLRGIPLETIPKIITQIEQ